MSSQFSRQQKSRLNQQVTSSLRDQNRSRVKKKVSTTSVMIQAQMQSDISEQKQSIKNDQSLQTASPRTNQMLEQNRQNLQYSELNQQKLSQVNQQDLIDGGISQSNQMLAVHQHSDNENDDEDQSKFSRDKNAQHNRHSSLKASENSNLKKTNPYFYLQPKQLKLEPALRQQRTYIQGDNQQLLKFKEQLQEYSNKLRNESEIKNYTKFQYDQNPVGDAETEKSKFYLLRNRDKEDLMEHTISLTATDNNFQNTITNYDDQDKVSSVSRIKSNVNTQKLGQSKLNSINPSIKQSDLPSNTNQVQNLQNKNGADNQFQEEYNLTGNFQNIKASKQKVKNIEQNNEDINLIIIQEENQSGNQQNKIYDKQNNDLITMNDFSYLNNGNSVLLSKQASNQLMNNTSTLNFHSNKNDIDSSLLQTQEVCQIPITPHQQASNSQTFFPHGIKSQQNQKNEKDGSYQQKLQPFTAKSNSSQFEQFELSFSNKKRSLANKEAIDMTSIKSSKVMGKWNQNNFLRRKRMSEKSNLQSKDIPVNSKAANNQLFSPKKIKGVSVQTNSPQANDLILNGQNTKAGLSSDNSQINEEKRKDQIQIGQIKDNKVNSLHQHRFSMIVGSQESQELQQSLIKNFLTSPKKAFYNTKDLIRDLQNTLKQTHPLDKSRQTNNKNKQDLSSTQQQDTQQLKTNISDNKSSVTQQQQIISQSEMVIQSQTNFTSSLSPLLLKQNNGNYFNYENHGNKEFKTDDRNVNSAFPQKVRLGSIKNKLTDDLHQNFGNPISVSNIKNFRNNQSYMSHPAVINSKSNNQMQDKAKSDLSQLQNPQYLNDHSSTNTTCIKKNNFKFDYALEGDKLIYNNEGISRDRSPEQKILDIKVEISEIQSQQPPQRRVFNLLQQHKQRKIFIESSDLKQQILQTDLDKDIENIKLNNEKLEQFSNRTQLIYSKPRHLRNMSDHNHTVKLNQDLKNDLIDNNANSQKQKEVPFRAHRQLKSTQNHIQQFRLKLQQLKSQEAHMMHQYNSQTANFSYENQSFYQQLRKSSMNQEQFNLLQNFYRQNYLDNVSNISSLQINKNESMGKNNNGQLSPKSPPRIEQSPLNNQHQSLPMESHNHSRNKSESRISKTVNSQVQSNMTSRNNQPSKSAGNQLVDQHLKRFKVTTQNFRLRNSIMHSHTNNTKNNQNSKKLSGPVLQFQNEEVSLSGYENEKIANYEPKSSRLQSIKHKDKIQKQSIKVNQDTGIGYVINNQINQQLLQQAQKKQTINVQLNAKQPKRNDSSRGSPTHYYFQTGDESLLKESSRLNFAKQISFNKAAINDFKIVQLDTSTDHSPTHNKSFGTSQRNSLQLPHPFKPQPSPKLIGPQTIVEQQTQEQIVRHYHDRIFQRQQYLQINQSVLQNSNYSVNYQQMNNFQLFANPNGKIEGNTSIRNNEINANTQFLNSFRTESHQGFNQLNFNALNQNTGYFNGQNSPDYIISQSPINKKSKFRNKDPQKHHHKLLIDTTGMNSFRRSSNPSNQNSTALNFQDQQQRSKISSQKMSSELVHEVLSAQLLKSKQLDKGLLEQEATSATVQRNHKSFNNSPLKQPFQNLPLHRHYNFAPLDQSDNQIINIKTPHNGFNTDNVNNSNKIEKQNSTQSKTPKPHLQEYSRNLFSDQLINTIRNQ